MRASAETLNHIQISRYTFTIASQEALATVFGPLIKVPVRVYVALWIKRAWFKTTAARSPA